jgi:hypothetical protein
MPDGIASLRDLLLSMSTHSRSARLMHINAYRLICWKSKTLTGEQRSIMHQSKALSGAIQHNSKMGDANNPNVLRQKQ